eukprot:5942923-Amphidinium_carterae.1
MAVSIPIEVKIRSDDARVTNALSVSRAGHTQQSGGQGRGNGGKGKGKDRKKRNANEKTRISFAPSSFGRSMP